MNLTDNELTLVFGLILAAALPVWVWCEIKFSNKNKFPDLDL